jgi:thymidylate synthase ThyX
VQYPSDDLTPQERARVAPHFTDLDGPVFALTNLPETVKGALFARYSRYPGTLRRLFLDEFADSLPEYTQGFDGTEGERAAQLYERIFVGYGDDSVAQLGGAHVACEWTSNILTKILQRPRLGAYLEQSTRYIAYDTPMPGGDARGGGDDGRRANRGGADARGAAGGGYRYYRDEELGPAYARAMDALFDAYAQALPRVRAWVDETYPRADGEPEAARRRAVNAKTYDLLRGLLPAASLSHMGIYATGQAYEQLILHLIGHPLPEARRYGELILAAIKAVMPSFVARVERPDRGGAWASYLQQRRAAAEHWTARLGLERENDPDERPSVKLLHTDGDEDRLLAALLFESAGTSEDETIAAVAELGDEERARMLADLVGERDNRRHRPGRGFEALRYRFEVVSDYGAFRDLQRHRMLTVQWQTLTPDLGAAVPEEVEAAGCGDDYRAALRRSREAYEQLVATGHAEAAPYALCLGYRMRYILDLNAREAMHLIELRSGREGHPGYRAVAHEMHAQIAQRHPAVAAAMSHVDTSEEPRLERILAEMRQERRRAAALGR